MASSVKETVVHHRHPLVQLSEHELRVLLGGVGLFVSDSEATGSYDATELPKMCCDGVKVCCCAGRDISESGARS